MRISYKCRKCKKKLQIEPNFDKVHDSLRLTIINALIGLTKNDYCYNCCDIEEEETNE